MLGAELLGPRWCAAHQRIHQSSLKAWVRRSGAQREWQIVGVAGVCNNAAALAHRNRHLYEQVESPHQGQDIVDCCCQVGPVLQAFCRPGGGGDAAALLLLRAVRRPQHPAAAASNSLHFFANGLYPEPTCILHIHRPAPAADSAPAGSNRRRRQRQYQRWRPAAAGRWPAAAGAAAATAGGGGGAHGRRKGAGAARHTQAAV
jgi:hypothetical protein